ncbi:sigma-70 family RNA polymerase sigma factor [Sphingosinithalassobacter portus]|uniref:sigma-70 family RNA polymerase sigma factor n=1 Tax=Stakelama portus TaxID=2676234 RepID=UPI001379CB23|nr:sigma-70 family RNA polymerase sigma factor [Sphingosinithalassobacter portus]
MTRVGLDIVLVPPRVEASLWRRLRFEREIRCREQLFSRYRNLARGLAVRQLRRRPDNGIELGDMEQFAYEGLLHAIDRYDPVRGVPFGAFARRRILGCIIDGAARLNELDAQYGYRRKMASERLASVADAATGAGDTLAVLTEMVSSMAIGVMLDDTGMIEREDGADHRPSAYESLAWRQLHGKLRSEIERLPEREAMIIRQHYGNGVSFRQVAQLLGVTPGRVSQLHAKALRTLRRRIGE